MTFREMLMQDHPVCVDRKFGGGCKGCPCTYGYEKERPDACKTEEFSCTDCWNREKPGAEFLYKQFYMGKEWAQVRERTFRRLEQLRPCEVCGQRCYFHRFIEEERGILQINAFMKPETIEKVRRMYEEDGVMSNCCTLEKIRHAWALVEFPDGQLKKVEPEAVKFLDRRG